jgi:hypothetical protein
MQLIDNWSNCALVIGGGEFTAAGVIVLIFASPNSRCAELFCRRAISKYKRPILMHTRRRNGWIPVAQANEHSSLLTAGHQPKDAPGPVDDWKGQGHPASALVGAGHRDVCVGDIEDRIPRHQRCGVAVCSEAEMNEIKHRRQACHVLQCRRVLLSRAIEVGCFDRHCMDVVGEQWCMSEQAFAEMSKVSVRIACRCRPLVHLNDMYILPGELFVGQCAQHQPRRAVAADRHDEASSRRNSRASVDGDDRCRPAGDQIVVEMDFNLHAMTSSWDTPIGAAMGRH